MMTNRDIRRLAFQLLFQLDARPDLADDELRDIAQACADETGLHAEARALERAVSLARGAFDRRADADREIGVFAPTWPAHRQPAADRAILRIAHFEMTSGDLNPKIPVNEAVELAKEFGTERSPGFVNAVLDKVLKAMAADAAHARPAGEEAG